ncbi:MAG TPA: MAPEG family protein [Xanthobacteraceae bacterium]|jgi:uncharacterized MAPEG superfamily protein
MTDFVEMRMLSYAIAFGIFQLVLCVSFNVAGRGLAYGVGPRDEPPMPLGKIASRIERAYKNFLETFAFFAAAVFLVYALDRSTPSSTLGAQIYVWSRLLYLPAYVIGVPVVRTLCWTASIVGIVMVMAVAWPR